MELFDRIVKQSRSTSQPRYFGKGNFDSLVLPIVTTRREHGTKTTGEVALATTQPLSSLTVGLINLNDEDRRDGRE